MNKQRSRRLVTPALILLVLCAAAPAWPQKGARRAEDVWGPRFKSAQAQPARPKHPSPNDTLSRLRHWNEVAVNSSGLDHTPVPLGDPRVFGEQLGPARASRAIAIVHIAVFEAVNTIKGGYQSYVGLAKGSPGSTRRRGRWFDGSRGTEARPRCSRRLRGVGPGRCRR